VDAIGLLIKTLADKYAWFDITGNRWDAGSHAAASGRFCRVEGKGNVSNNHLGRGELAWTPVAAAPIIKTARGLILTDGKEWVT